MTSRPCKLDRQDCLIGGDLAARLMLPQSTTIRPLEAVQDLSTAEASQDQSPSPGAQELVGRSEHCGRIHPQLSLFEEIFTARPPILEVLLLHLPTSAILNLYHTSHHLRTFLQSYPLAWKNLSFRLLPAQVHPQATDSGFESPGSGESKKPYALDLFLQHALPATDCLARLDLDNTSVSGTELHTNILAPRRSTLVHLSVRGCKDVSIKYHIIPFLHMQMSTPPELFRNKPFALRSLYTYRCRHHRRRPYLPSSLSRRDSDSQPTHQLIEMCHHLGIYTDTAWCPTPGGRCYRRKDYFLGRSGAGAGEVWVPFDRLWRSQNIVGSAGFTEDTRHVDPSGLDHGIGRLWEDGESGYGGEALGSAGFSSGEGKEVPVHHRASHRTFVEDFTCHSCGDKILERCEQCSVRMHCMGCRKTLCHSCAFDRPVAKRRRRNVGGQAQMTLSMILGTANAAPVYGRNRSKRQEQPRRRDLFWWAPGASRSPNLMREELSGADASDSDDDTVLDNTTTVQQTLQVTSILPPRLEMHWCCLKPSFSGGGGIGFLGTPCGDNVRAAPLPQGRGFEDPYFSAVSQKGSASDASSQCDSSEESFTSDDSGHTSSTENPLIRLQENDAFSVLPYLEQPQDPTHISFRRYAAPRNLCTDCYTSAIWKIPCAECQYPICIEHDLKRLKVRQCGFRRLSRERTIVQQCKELVKQGQTVPRSIADANIVFFLAKWRPIVAQMAAIDRDRRQQCKWTPDNNRPRRIDPLYAGNVQADCPTPLSREQLVLPNFEALAIGKQDHGSITDATGLIPNGAGQDVVNESDGPSITRVSSPSPRRAQSASSLAYMKPAFPPQHSAAASSESLARGPSTSTPSLIAPSAASKSTTATTTTTESDRTTSPASTSHGITTSSQQNNQQKPHHNQTPLFLGCLKLLCPSPRRPGDTRPSCPAQNTASYCHTCGILVCSACRAANPPCPCKPCNVVFRCPNCAGEVGVKRACRREVEERERRECGWGEEFWRGVEAGVVGE